MEIEFGKRKYKKTDHTNLVGKRIIQFEEQMDRSEQNTGFKVISQGDGMHFSGELNRSIGTVAEAEEFLDELRSLLAEAWKARMLLKPKLTQNLAGH